jgi:hypothetical protein
VPVVVELRVYTLKPGTRDAFQRRFADEVRPMLARFGVTVVAAEPSLDDERSFTLIRAFPSLAEREAQLARFYGSEEWLTRHEDAVMGMIEQYGTCVIEAEALTNALTTLA